MAHDVRPGMTLARKFRPKVYIVDGAVFLHDAKSVAYLLSAHRIWATPVGVRPARNQSPEQNLPCVLSQEQATLVMRKNLADVVLGHPRLNVNDDEEPQFSGLPAKESFLCQMGWHYPGTLKEATSMAVFEDLWERGLCVASGSNYGADYAVYTGPPTESHSVATILVSRGPRGGELSPAEISGFARVQQAVAKRAVIATTPSAPLASTEQGASASDSNRRSLDNGGEHTELTSEEVERSRDVRYVTLQFDSVSSRTV